MVEQQVKCPTCDRPVPATATSCPYDGTRLPVFVSQPGTDVPHWSEPTSVRRAPTGPENATDSLIGQQLGDYVITERLGKGGMGIVYRGEQPMIGKRVAIKVLRPEIAADENQVKRLLAEARAVNAIRHRGIIDIFNFGQLPDGRHYVVMEYLDGESLDQLLHRRGPLPPDEVITILDETLSALGAGHEAGIIHRDLKPSNIHLVSEPNGQRYVKVLDFGLAKHSDPIGTGVTSANLVVGTPEYMAPEQARAEPVTARSDLYALGMLAYELLCGRLPFDGSTAFEWMTHQVNTPPPPPSEFAGGIPPQLEALVLRLLDKAPENRPANADLVRRELTRIRRALNDSATQVTGQKKVRGSAPRPGNRPQDDLKVPPLLTPPATGRVDPSVAATQLAAKDTIERRLSKRSSKGPIYIGTAIGIVALIIAGAVVLSRPERHRQAQLPGPAENIAQPQPLHPPPPIVPEPQKQPDLPPDDTLARADPPVHQDEPLKVDPAEAGHRVESSPSRASLLQQIDHLERVAKSSPKASLRSSPAMVEALLEKARQLATSAKTPADRVRAAKYLHEVEQKNFTDAR